MTSILGTFPQAAFLSTLAGVDVAEAAARAAVMSLSQVNHGVSGVLRSTKLQGTGSSFQDLISKNLGFGCTYLAV